MLTRSRWEAVATCMTPGARLTHGRVATTYPMALPMVEYVSRGFAAVPEIHHLEVTDIVDLADYIARKEAQHDV